MKNASKVFYTIGLVLNIIGLVFLALSIVLFAVSLTNQELLQKVATDTSRTVEFVKNVLTLGIIFISIHIVVEIIVLFLVIHAKKNLSLGNGRITTHVLLLILGIFGFNLFYLLGGIFGMVAGSEDANK
ncbi:MAG: hypothetical protein J6M95_04770 [Bacilli bacterium]|nr:hypothetical protein [Bacilli bacterium]